MTNSVISINGVQLKRGYEKSESDSKIKTLLGDLVSRCRKLSVNILDLYVPYTTPYNSPDDAVFDFLEIIKSRYPNRQASFIWKKDKIKYGKNGKTRYRVAIGLEQFGFDDDEGVIKYALKSWAEVHDYKLKDVYRTNNLLAKTDALGYCIEDNDDTPPDLVIDHISSYFDPTITPQIL